MTYILVFVGLFIVTAAEVVVTFEPFRSIIPQLPALLALAVLKGLAIVLFYMHLKFDSRAFSALLIVGLILAVSMVLTFMALFLAHYREPFDEHAWRETLQQSSGGAGATGGATGSGAGTSGTGGGH